MNTNKKYDFVVIGGGLAGLSLAILLGKENKSVALMEKNSYPKHKVCGEYISNESWPFLQELGLKLENLDLPKINKLQISSPKGKLLSTNLDLGGFGISRYMIDDLLYDLALECGVDVYTKTKVESVVPFGEGFKINMSQLTIESNFVFGAYGKRSNLDIQLNREFIKTKHRGLDNYVGVKYHIKYEMPLDTIELHNFDNGYCGISNIEKGKCCLCYLTTSRNLEKSKNNINRMEKEILHKNKFLKRIWENAEFIYDKPLAISQISFAKRSIYNNGVIMLGDAAGVIPPLSGNGMSMALHSSHLMMESLKLIKFDLTKKEELVALYSRKWESNFKNRMWVGRWLQKFFGHPMLTEILIEVTKIFPVLAKKLINATHGQKF